MTPYDGGEPDTQARSFSPGVVKGPRASVTASVALTTAGWANRCPAYTGPPSLSLGMLDGEWGEVAKDRGIEPRHQGFGDPTEAISRPTLEVGAGVEPARWPETLRPFPAASGLSGFRLYH